MISNETLLKIEDLFRHLQMNDCPSVQKYDSEQEYRTFCVFATGLDWRRNCQSVHLNFPIDKLRPWHIKNWEKRKNGITAEPFMTRFENENVVRFGFR